MQDDKCVQDRSREDSSPWLDWAREIQALSQTGLHFSESEYDTHRYSRLMEIAAEIVERHTGLASGPLLEAFSAQLGYATPKIDVRGAIVEDGKILLVQERVDGKWCMPGGWADVGDGPSEMVVREVWEEAGLKVRPIKLIGVYDANRDQMPLQFFHAYKLVFLCDVIGGAPTPGEETLAVDYFRLDKLPPLSTERTNERYLRDVFVAVEKPGKQVFFD